MENNLHIEHIFSELVSELAKSFLDQLIDEGKTDIPKLLNKIDDEDAKALITRLSVDKYRVSRRDTDVKNDHFSGIAEEKVNIKFARDVLKRLEKRKYESELEKLPKTEEYLEKRQELRLKINALEKS